MVQTQYQDFAIRDWQTRDRASAPGNGLRVYLKSLNILPLLKGESKSGVAEPNRFVDVGWGDLLRALKSILQLVEVWGNVIFPQGPTNPIFRHQNPL